MLVDSVWCFCVVSGGGCRRRVGILVQFLWVCRTRGTKPTIMALFATYATGSFPSFGWLWIGVVGVVWTHLCDDGGDAKIC